LPGLLTAGSPDVYLVAGETSFVIPPDVALVACPWLDLLSFALLGHFLFLPVALTATRLVYIVVSPWLP
jgi:hypothetical protein